MKNSPITNIQIKVNPNSKALEKRLKNLTKVTNIELNNLAALNIGSYSHLLANNALNRIITAQKAREQLNPRTSK